VLDVAVFADADGLDVAPQDGAEPDADAVGQRHIPHDLRIVCDKDASPHHRLAAAKGTDHAAAPSLIDKKRLSAWTISAQAPDFLRSYAPLSPPSPGTGPRSRDRCGSDRRGTRTTGGPPPRLGRPARPRLRPRGTRRRSGRTKARRTSGTGKGCSAGTRPARIRHKGRNSARRPGRPPRTDRPRSAARRTPHTPGRGS